MSHFTVAVFTEPNGKSVDELLAPYNEELEVPHYTSKEELIDRERKAFERYRDTTYALYLKDPEGYTRTATPPHIKYVSEEFPKRFNWGDEEFYQEAIRYEESENICEDGALFSSYNPNSKWDWYDIGGRWGNLLQLKNGSTANSAKIKDIDFDKMGDFCTYAALTPNGQWHAPGEMGWWGMSSETDDEYSEWKAKFFEKFIQSADQDWELSVVDCHI